MTEISMAKILIPSPHPSPLEGEGRGEKIEHMVQTERTGGLEKL